MHSLRGPILMVIAMAFFAVEDALIKALAVRVPAGQVAVILGLGGAGVFWALARSRGVVLFVPGALRGAALVRNLSEMLAVMGMILSVALVPLSVVSAILQVMPLTVTMAAALVLGEPVGWRRWGAILVGFAGVLLILRPGTADFDHLVLLPLAAVVALTARDIATRRVPQGISSLQLSGWGFMAAIPGGVLLLLLRGETPVTVTGPESLMLLATITTGIFGYGALVLATRAGDLGLTTPFRYTRLVFAMLLGIALFGERPDLPTLAGSALIVAAGLYTFLRELRLRRQ